MARSKLSAEEVTYFETPPDPTPIKVKKEWGQEFSDILILRCTTQMRTLVSEAAKRDGITMSEFVRDAIESHYPEYDVNDSDAPGAVRVGEVA